MKYIVLMYNVMIPSILASFVIAPYIQRSVAKVEWSAGGPANVYRVGHKGKVMSLQVVQNIRKIHTASLAHSVLFA